MHKTWTEVENEYIRVNAHILKDVALTEQLNTLNGKNLSVQAVRKHRKKLGIFKASGRGYCKLRVEKLEEKLV
jgi:hypothetical protein